MKKLILIFLFNALLLLTVFVMGSHAGVFSIDTYLGMHTTESELLIPIETSKDMDNCDPSEDGMTLLRKKGQKALFTLAYSTHHATSLGNVKNNVYDKLLVGYGPHVEAIDTAYSSTMLHSSATVGYVWDYAKSIDGNTYCTNGIDTVFYTDGNTKTFLPQAPKGTSIVFFNNTCMISDITGDRARLFIGVYGDASDWTTGDGTTDGDSIDVADYGEKIVTLEVLGNSVLILCSQSIMKLIGNQNPYLIVEVDKSIGCKSKGSVSNHLGWVYFLGSDGQKYKTNGSIVEDISSEEFYDDFNNTALAQKSSNFSTITTETEFALGITSYTSTSISPGGVVPSSFTLVHTSSGDWTTWTTINVDITSVVGSVLLSTRSVSTAISYVRTPELAIPLDSANKQYAIAFLAPGFLITRVDLRLRQNGVPLTHNFIVSIYTGDSSGPNVFLSSAVVEAATLQATFNTESFVFGTPVTYQAKHYIVVSFPAGTSELPVELGYNTVASPPTYPDSFVTSDGGSIWIQTSIFLWNGVTVNQEQYQPSGQSVSPIIDIGEFNLVWGTLNYTETRPSLTTHTVLLRVSTDSAMGDNPSYTTIDNGALIGLDSKRYVQIKSSMVTGNVVITPQLDDVTLSWATTGYYITSEIPITDINSWGLFEVADDQSDVGASISYFTFSSNTIVNDFDLQLSTKVTWVAQTTNSTIVVATNTYVWGKAVYDIAVATEAPRIDAISFNWVSGSDTNEDMTAYWHNERLYVGVMKSTVSSTNDACFIYDPKLDAWWKYKTNTFPSVLYQWKNMFLIASSTYGVIAQFLEGDKDLGYDIDAYYKTKYISVGGLNTISSFESISYVYDQQSSGNLLVDYYLNGSTTKENTFTLDQTGGDAIHIESFNFPLATNAYFIQFKIYNSGGSDFSFHGFYGTTKEFPFRVDQ